MFSKVLRKILNFIRIPFTFKNWGHVIVYVLSIYLSTNSRQGTGLVILKGGQKLRIRLKHLYDIGSIIETCQRKVYCPSTFRMPDKATIVDVGASIGDFSVCCASSFRCAKVFSYEPDKDAFELLKENISLNLLEDRVKPYPLAVSGVSGKITIGREFFDATSIEEIFTKNKIGSCDFLKMDIEGAEYDVLLKTPKEILKRINTIAMECHIYDRGENLNRLRTYLIETGFDVTTTKVTAHNVCYLYARIL